DPRICSRPAVWAQRPKTRQSSTVFARGTGTGRPQPASRTDRRAPHRSRNNRRAAGFRNNDGSCGTCFLTRIAVQLAEQGIAIFCGPICKVDDEGFDLLARGFAQGFRAREIDSIGFHKLSIQVVLANDLAEAIANTGAVSVYSVAMAAMTVRGLGRKLPNWAFRRLLPLESTNLLNRANANSIRLAQCPIYGARFRD